MLANLEVAMRNALGYYDLNRFYQENNIGTIVYDAYVALLGRERADQVWKEIKDYGVTELFTTENLIEVLKDLEVNLDAYENADKYLEAYESGEYLDLTIITGYQSMRFGHIDNWLPDEAIEMDIAIPRLKLELIDL